MKKKPIVDGRNCFVFLREERGDLREQGAVCGARQGQEIHRLTKTNNVLPRHLIVASSSPSLIFHSPFLSLSLPPFFSFLLLPLPSSRCQSNDDGPAVTHRAHRSRRRRPPPIQRRSKPRRPSLPNASQRRWQQHPLHRPLPIRECCR